MAAARSHDALSEWWIDWSVNRSRREGYRRHLHGKRPRVSRRRQPSAPPASSCPPARMPLFRAGRMLKRWRYVGLYGPEIMLCVGSAHIGPTWQVWWAVWDRRARRLDERTRQSCGRRRVEAERAGRLHVDDGGRVDRPRARRGPGRRDGDSGGAHVHLDAQAGRHPGSRARARGRPRSGRWTGPRSWTSRRATTTASRRGAGPPGVGNARPTGARWLELRRGHPRLAARQRAHRVGRRRAVGAGARCASPSDLSSIALAGGGELRCAAEATRRRDDNLLVLRSRYEQPFGTFSRRPPRRPRAGRGLRGDGAPRSTLVNGVRSSDLTPLR